MKIRYTLTLKECHQSLLRNMLVMMRLSPLFGCLGPAMLILLEVLSIGGIVLIIYLRYVLKVPMSSSASEQTSTMLLALIILGLEAPAILLISGPLHWLISRQRKWRSARKESSTGGVSAVTRGKRSRFWKRAPRISLLPARRAGQA